MRLPELDAEFRDQFLRLKGYDPVPWLVTFGTPVLGTDKWNGR